MILHRVACVGWESEDASLIFEDYKSLNAREKLFSWLSEIEIFFLQRALKQFFSYHFIEFGTCSIGLDDEMLGFLDLFVFILIFD